MSNGRIQFAMVGLMFLMHAVLLSGVVAAGTAAEQITIIPKPQLMEIIESVRLPLGAGAAVLVVGDDADQQSLIGAEYINARCRELGLPEIPVKTASNVAAESAEGKNLILLGRPGENSLLDDVRREKQSEFAGKYNVTPDQPGPQGYVIRFLKTKGGSVAAALCGSDSLGTLYAACSFRFLITKHGAGAFAQGVAVWDRPDFRERMIGRMTSLDMEGIKQQIDFSAMHKINALWSVPYQAGLPIEGDTNGALRIQLRWPPAEGLAINRYARARGIRILVGGGLGFAQKAAHPGACQVYKEKKADLSALCFGDEVMMQRRIAALKQFIRDYEPGIFQIHGVDRATMELTQMLWKRRCKFCRERWPSDEITALDGKAGSWIYFVRRIHQAVREEPAGKNIGLYFVMPPYPLYTHTPAMADQVCRLWNLVAEHTPADISLCAREICADYTRKLATAMPRGQRINMYMKTYTEETQLIYLPFAAFAKTFLTPQTDYWFCGNQYPGYETTLLTAAEYTWNSAQTGGYSYETYADFAGWVQSMDDDMAPYATCMREVLPRLCRYLYGGAANEMERVFSINPKILNITKLSSKWNLTARGQAAGFADTLADATRSPLSYKQLADKYRGYLVDIEKAWPHIQNAEVIAARNDAILPLHKSGIADLRLKTEEAMFTARALANMAQAHYHYRAGDVAAARAALAEAESAMRGFEEIPGTVRKNTLGRVLHKSFVQVRVEIKYLAGAALLAHTAQEQIQLRRYADAERNIRAALARLDMEQACPDETEAQYARTKIEEMRLQLTELQKRNAWRQATFADAPPPPDIAIKAGIYHADMFGGQSRGAIGIAEAFHVSPEISVSKVSGFAPDQLAAFDVLIFPGIIMMGTVDDNWREAVRDFAAKGGGVIFTHNACGGRQPDTVYRFGPSVFPDIVKGIAGRSEIRKITIKAEHPICQGLRVGDHFETQYYDHMNLIPGPRGTVVADDPDPMVVASIGHAAAGAVVGAPVIVAGEHGAGRVVYFGNSPGFGQNQQNREMAPEYGEYLVLLNAVKWAAQGKNVP